MKGVSDLVFFLFFLMFYHFCQICSCGRVLISFPILLPALHAWPQTKLVRNEMFLTSHSPELQPIMDALVGSDKAACILRPPFQSSRAYFIQ